MTDKRYTRLKLKMLALVVAGTLAAVAAGLFILEVIIDGVLQDPFARGFIWVATHLFGQGEAAALALYQQVIRNHKQEILTAGVFVLMLIAFYLAMGPFTRWLDKIASAIRLTAEEDRAPIALPKELAPLEQDLNHLRLRLQDREAAARESESRKRDLVAFLAHDLKTPLTSVVGYLTLLRDAKGLTEAQRQKYTGVALDKAERLEELLNEFFDITNMELHSETDSRCPIQLSMLLEQLSDEFYPLLAEKALTCRADIAPRLSVYGEADKLARALDNILRNAVSYSTPGGEVTLTARQTGAWAEIVVGNEGLAVPEGELTNIFQKFYRLDAARSTRTGGAGLGLAIAKEIIEFHQGTIQAESDGRLTRFVIRLPLLKEQESQDGTAPRREAESQ